MILSSKHKLSKSRKLFFTKHSLILILIIFSAVLMLWIYLAYVIRQESLKGALDQQQSQMVISYNTLVTDMKQAEYVFTTLQNVSSFCYFCSGYYNSVAEMYTSFLVEVRPLLKRFCYSSPYINSIVFYSTRDDDLKISSEISNINLLSMEPAYLKRLSQLRYRDCLWTITDKGSDNISELPTIKYYHLIYDINYSRANGYIEITLSNSVLQSLITNIRSDVNDSQKNIVILKDGAAVYENTLFQVPDTYTAKIDRALTQASTNTCIYSNKYYSNILYINSLDAYVISTGKVSSLTGKINYFMLQGTTLLFVLLIIAATLLFLKLSKISSRILRFAEHIKNSSGNQLELYTEDAKPDEIGRLITTYNHSLQRINELVDMTNKLETLNREARFTALQMQMHPHFIYGILETIRMLALQAEDYGVEKLTYSFSALMRYSLSDKSSVTLEEELKQSKNYMYIQDIRFSDRLTYSFRTDAPVDRLICPPLILQPLLENAIIHGTNSSSSSATNIKTTISMNADNEVFIEIYNSCDYVDQKRIEKVNEMLRGNLDIKAIQTKTSGIALYNINERLKYFFKQSNVISLECGNNGVTAKIHIKKGMIGNENTNS